MSDLRDLYQEVVLDHNRRPRNFRKIEPASRRANGYNPLCGDKVTVYLKVENGMVTDVAFEGAGCAISTASASMMTESLKGKSEAHADQLFKNFHHLITGSGEGEVDPEILGKLAVFSGVCDYPARVKCATLAWHTMQAALKDDEETVSTE